MIRNVLSASVIAAALLACIAIVSPVQTVSRPAPTPTPVPSNVPYPAYGSPAPDVAQLHPKPGVPATVTLSQAIDIAVVRAPSFASQRAQYEAIRARYAAAQQAFFPSVSASGSTTRNFGGANNNVIVSASPTPSSGVSFGPTTSMNASVNVQELIFDGGRVIAALKSAKFADLAGRNTLLRQLQTLANTVSTQYFAVLQAKATVASDVQLVRQFQVTEDSVRAEIRAGTAAQSDLASAQFQTARARSQLVTAQGQAIAAQSTFASTIGLDADTAVVPQQTTTPATSSALPSYDKALAQALAQRPDYLAAQFNVTSQFQNLRFAKLARFPSITANASDGVNKILPVERQFTHSSSIGAQISVPIFDQGLTNNNIAQAASQYDQAVAALTQNKLTVESDVRSALANLISARASFAQAQLELHSAQVSLAADQAKYRVGVATILNLVTDEANLAQAETDYNVALYNTQTAEQNYLFATGINELHL